MFNLAVQRQQCEVARGEGQKLQDGVNQAQVQELLVWI